MPVILEFGVTNDLHEFDPNVEDVQEVEEQAANTEVVQSLQEKEVDQDLFLIQQSLRARKKRMPKVHLSNLEA